MAWWLVDHGAREGVEVVSRHPTPELAARSVRERFGAPFRVAWEPLDLSPDGDEAVLVGVFAPVPGFAAAHTACFCMRRLRSGRPPDRALGAEVA